MEHQVRRLAHKCRRIVLHCRDDRLDRFLTEFLRDLGAALGGELGDVRRRRIAAAARDDGRVKAVEDVFGRGVAHTCRTLIPAAARVERASERLASPKWKIDAASTALAWPSVTPRTRSSSPPTPP